MTKPLIIAEQICPPGSTRPVAIPVTQDLGGGALRLWAHVVAGAQPGPTLTLLSAVRGEGFLTVEFIRRLIRDLKPEQLRGNLVAVPVCNPVAFAHLTRRTPDESDQPDVNRAFPGEYTRLADQLAGAISQHILPITDCLVDFHTGPWGVSSGYIGYPADIPDGTTQGLTEEAAYAFGWPCLRKVSVVGFPGAGSVLGQCCVEHNIPAIYTSLGGSGFSRRSEQDWMSAYRRGVLNLLKFMGILAGEMESLPERYLVWERRWSVCPTVGGYLRPALAPDALLVEVMPGDVLGEVYSPYTFEVLQRLEAPGEGMLFMNARDHPVRPGYWAFGVIDYSDAGTRWVENLPAG